MSTLRPAAKRLIARMKGGGPSQRGLLLRASAAVAIALAIAATIAALHHEGPQATSPLDQRLPEIREGITLAADYLHRHCDDSGRFVYRTHAGGKNLGRRKYNALRHAGSIYSLVDFYGYSEDDEARRDARRTIEDAVTYLRERQIRPLRDHPDIHAMWSQPQEEGSDSGRPQAKLGGAALGIIAFMSARSIDERIVPLAEAQALGRFILFMQEENGDFRAKYEDERGFDADFESLYYPGEAILALTMLFEGDRDVTWLRAAALGVDYLVDSRRGSLRLPNDHWLMIASERMLRHFDALPDPPLAREEVEQHAVDLGRTMIDEQFNVTHRTSDPDLVGSFLLDGRSTPTATRLEGLVALERIVRGKASHADLNRDLRSSIASGVLFLRRCQVLEGELRGGITEALIGAQGAREDNDHEIRIDYVQHAMSAMIGYEKMCAEGVC